MNRTLTSVPIATEGGQVTPGPPQALFKRTLSIRGDAWPQYDVSSDGRFLLTVEVPGPTTPITLVQNWKAPN